MAWSRGRSAAAVAVGALSALGNAQAFFGGDESSCSATQAFVDLGCFVDLLSLGLTPFSPVSYDPSLQATLSFPGFDPGSNFNNTVTPQSCVEVCRGYGYRTAALESGECSCGYGLPLGFPNPPALPGNCNTPCPGDASQFCGGAGSIRILVDPTFADPALLNAAPPGEVAGYYQYLGCFHQDASFPTNDLVNTRSTQANVDLCLQRCATLRYPLARATPDG